MTRRASLGCAAVPLAMFVALATPGAAGEVRAAKAKKRNTAADPAGGLSFTKTRLAAPTGKIRLVMRNPGGSGLDHGIGIRRKRDAPVAPGERSRVTVRIRQPGTYTFYCTFPGHRSAGMKGRLTVTE
jgi:uncharacterized cupredoxin-like copper-binding protein